MPKSNRCFSNLTSPFAATGHRSGLDADLEQSRPCRSRTSTRSDATEVRIPTPTPMAMDPRSAQPSKLRRCRAGPRRAPPLPCADVRRLSLIWASPQRLCASYFRRGCAVCCKWRLWGSLQGVVASILYHCLSLCFPSVCDVVFLSCRGRTMSS